MMNRAFFAAVAAAFVFTASAETLYWTGTTPRWGNAGAWTNSAGEATALASGDSVVIDIGEAATTMQNDIENLSLAKFTAFGKNNVNLTIDGKTIGLTGTTGINNTLWTNHCSLVLNADVSLTGGKGRMCFAGYSTVVHGNINVESGSALKFLGRPNKASAGVGLISSDPVIEFHGDVGGDGCTLYLNMGANKQGTTGYFYGNVNCGTLYIGGDTCPFSVHFMKPGNRVGTIRFFAVPAYFDVNEALTADTVVNFTDTSVYSWDSSSLRFKEGSRQTLNRLEGIDTVKTSRFSRQRIFASASGSYGTPSSSACTLELKGSANAVSHVILCDAVNVEWNPVGDYTQDFRDCRHVTSGSISVKRGTVRSSGTNSFVNVSKVAVSANAVMEIASTNAVTFPKLALMQLDAGAKLRVTDAEATPFTAQTTVLSLGTGAKIDVVSGGVVEVGRLVYNGNEVAAGSYTSAEWLDGGGTVNVAGSIDAAALTKHYWIEARDGDWNVAANWHSGIVPGESDSAYLDIAGGDYTVTFDGASGTLPKKVMVTGNGNVATLAVTNETTLLSQIVDVMNGGRLLVTSESTLVNTNTAVVSVYEGGEAQVAGTGCFVSKKNSSDKEHPVRLRGGKLTFLDSATLVSRLSSAATSHAFTDGETVFAGSSTLVTPVKHDNVNVYSMTVGGEAKLKFIDSAGFYCNVYQDTLHVGDDNSGTAGKATIEFLSNYSHGRIYGGQVGSPIGDGTMLVGAGNVYFNGRGIGFGCSMGGRYSVTKSSGGVGRLIVTGGVLRVSSGGVSEGNLTGLRFGEGALVDASIANNYKPWTGYYAQSGGTITNSGCFCVGGERGTGYFIQTGGELYNTGAGNPFFTGIRGGSGQVTFAGGAATISGDVYAGGIFTNAIPHSDNTSYPLNRYGWKDFVHYGTGTITMSNGVVVLKKALKLGYDGTGIVERVGSLGSFTVQGDMVLSNTTEFASASILRFVLDADGIEPIQVGGTVTAAEGSRIEVDLSAYAGKKGRHALLTAASINGSFADAEITSSEGGHSVSGAKVLVESNGIYLTLPTGMVMIFH